MQGALVLFWGVCPWSHRSRKAKSLLDFCFWSCSKVLSKCLAVSRSSVTPLACHSHRWPVTLFLVLLSTH